MSTRTIKIIVDIFMTLFIILSFIRWDGTGGFIFHAAVGTVFALLMAVHLLLNRKWLPAVTKSIRAKKASAKTKRQYAVDIALIAVWGAVMLSGFLAIPLIVGDDETFRIFGRIHAISGRVGAALIIVHVYQHLGQIRSYLGIKKRQT